MSSLISRCTVVSHISTFLATSHVVRLLTLVMTYTTLVLLRSIAMGSNGQNRLFVTTEVHIVVDDVEGVPEKWKDVPDCSASRKEHVNSGFFSQMR
jgi:hypothetical protein